MKQFKFTASEAVAEVFAAYPVAVSRKLKRLRTVVIETARRAEGVGELVETLKWNEPSFVAKHGSTLRMGWKAKRPNQYAMYFKCTSRLVETFKQVFGDKFTYEGNRAVVFRLDETVPEAELARCIDAALRYHQLKHLPRLGL